MIRVAAILPCRGRPEQTARNVERLLATAGNVPGGWHLTCIGGAEDRDAVLACHAAGARTRCLLDRPRLTYWQAMEYETAFYATDGDLAPPLLVNLANDLLPGALWLQRAVQAYDAQGGRYQVLGFNDGISATAHFLVTRQWLDAHGGWPVWYDHMCGDLEIVERAQAEGVYASLPWAVLYHDHHMTGAARDAVYAEGETRWAEDRARFAARRAAGWPRA